MEACNHLHLELLPANKKRVRCRFCHLTIKADEIGDGFCPECFETHGEKRYDFEYIEAPEAEMVRYRCEGCGIIVES
jgi:hypothetical protein